MAKSVQLASEAALLHSTCTPVCPAHSFFPSLNRKLRPLAPCSLKGALAPVPLLPLVAPTHSMPRASRWALTMLEVVCSLKESSGF